MTLPPSHRGRRDNGLGSDRFSPVADVDPRLADHLLDVLGLRDVPAYVEPAPTTASITADRLFVAAHQTIEAREVLSEIAAELGIEVSRDGQRLRGQPVDPADDLLAGHDTDAEFAAIIAGLAELDRPLFDPYPSAASNTVAEPPPPVDHFVPPPAPPLPRPAAPTALAALTTLLGVVVIAFGGYLGLPGDVPLPLGVVLVLFGTVLLIMRLRPDPRDDSDDDGAVV